jgi:hypothetical protein
MYIKEWKLIFVHIPKAAGQSVERYFLSILGKRWEDRGPYLLSVNKSPENGPPRLAHLFASEFVEKNYLEKADYESSFKFTVVRDPFSRVVSEYLYRRRVMSFKKFVLNINTFKDDYSNGYDIARHLVPQAQFIFDKNDVKLVDLVIKMEELDNSFYKVQDYIGVERAVLGRLNSAEKVRPGMRARAEKYVFDRYVKGVESVEKYKYDDEVVGKIKDLYERDYRLLGY